MTEKDKKEGNERRYPLTPQAEANLKEVVPHVDEKLGGDIKDFVCSLRENIQGDVTTSLANFTNALRAMPVNNHVEKEILNYFLLIKEQIIGFGSKTLSKGLC